MYYRYDPPETQETSDDNNEHQIELPETFNNIVREPRTYFPETWIWKDFIIRF